MVNDSRPLWLLLLAFSCSNLSAQFDLVQRSTLDSSITANGFQVDETNTFEDDPVRDRVRISDSQTTIDEGSLVTATVSRSGDSQGSWGAGRIFVTGSVQAVRTDSGLVGSQFLVSSDGGWRASDFVVFNYLPGFESDDPIDITLRLESSLSFQQTGADSGSAIVDGSFRFDGFGVNQSFFRSGRFTSGQFGAAADGFGSRSDVYQVLPGTVYQIVGEADIDYTGGVFVPEEIGFGDTDGGIVQLDFQRWIDLPTGVEVISQSGWDYGTQPNVIPEPGSSGLLVAGTALAFCAVRRRRA